MVIAVSLAGLVVVVVLLSELLSICTGSKEWYRKWPAISDEEFLQRCGPEINPEIALKVREILSDAYGIERENIHPQQTMMDLEW